MLLYLAAIGESIDVVAFFRKRFAHYGSNSGIIFYQKNVQIGLLVRL
jgi:hypothetical protein